MMKTFYLKQKSNKNEIITRIEAVSIDQAIKFFSRIKNLAKDDLLKIFIVTDQL